MARWESRALDLACRGKVNVGWRFGLAVVISGERLLLVS